MKIVIGIFGIQGAIVDHEIAIKKSAEKLGIDFEIIKVKTKEDVEIINCLIIPGGESTTMRLLGQKNDVIDKINLSIDGGLPVFGTCAGAILLSKNVKKDEISETELGLFPFLDMMILRNGYGRQKNSFSSSLKIEGISNDFEGVFIRAPIIESVNDKVEILSTFDEKAVLVKSNNIFASTFHPELTLHTDIHELFLKNVLEYEEKSKV